jgi:hypothetical protein
MHVPDATEVNDMAAIQAKLLMDAFRLIEGLMVVVKTHQEKIQVLEARQGPVGWVE